MKNFPSYLKNLLDEKNISPTDLARRLGYTSPYVFQLLSGKKPPPKPQAMVRIVTALDCTEAEKEKLLNFSFQRSIGDVGKETNELRRDMMSLFNAVTASPGLLPVPILSWVSAGRFDYSSDADFPAGVGGEGSILTDAVGEHIFALKVDSNCMEPEFRHGDVVVVDPSAEWKNGDFVVVKLLDKDEATFKQLKVYDSKIILHPLNPSYNDIEFELKHFDKKAKVIGRVVRKLKSY